LAGEKEASIKIDLSKLERSDRYNGSSFIPAGRAYYEAEVVGYKISSFTSRGMLEKLNYHEPFLVKSPPFYEIYQWPLIIVAVAVIVFLIIRFEKQK